MNKELLIGFNHDVRMDWLIGDINLLYLVIFCGHNREDLPNKGNV